MVGPITFIASQKDRNFGLQNSMSSKPHISDIYDDNLPMTNVAIRFNYSPHRNFNAKPILIPSMCDKASHIPSSLTNLNLFYSQNEVCPMPKTSSTPPEHPQHITALGNECKIWNWLDSIDQHPYVPPECSTAVGFFSVLQNYWHYRGDTEKGDGVLGSECDLGCLSSLSEATFEQPSSLPCSMNCTPISSPAYSSDSSRSSKKSSSLSPIQYNGVTDSMKEEATVDRLLPNSRSLKDSNPNGFWDLIHREESETTSEMAEIWTEAPVFASCFFPQDEENHFFGLTPWSWESATSTNFFGERDCPSYLDDSYDKTDKEPTEESSVIRNTC
ncbi:unnamed protein product [Phytomonas sp. EM1]|nr:unnamed protein product [Phytomonas sp. EM1]|eukprot:CCW62275.1 unnamed protein product [Phytomonas sp. isolate EM1]